MQGEFPSLSQQQRATLRKAQSEADTACPQASYSEGNSLSSSSHSLKGTQTAGDKTPSPSEKPRVVRDPDGQALGVEVQPGNTVIDVPYLGGLSFRFQH